MPILMHMPILALKMRYVNPVDDAVDTLNRLSC